MAAELNQDRGKKVSVTTVKRHLAEVGLNGRVAVKKPLLRAINKKLRMKYAEDHLHWTRKDWANGLFTDESKFEFLVQSGVFMYGALSMNVQLNIVYC